MPQMRLHLFGTPRIEIDDRPVRIKRRKSLALVAFLALAERAQSRATVATMLWPEMDEAAARNALRSALPLLTALTDESWLLIDRTNLSLNHEIAWSDVGAFLAALARTRVHAHERERLCQECVGALEEAIQLYRDDFLAGFSVSESVEFDNWQTIKQEWLKREYNRALHRLAEHFSELNLERAIALTRRWLEVDSLSEPAHRLLMRLYTLNGQRAEALRQYQECVNILNEELATPPEAETIRLHEVIRSGGTPSALIPERQADSPATSIVPPLPPLIIGREAVLNEIKARLGIPNSDTHRSATVIEGWPGVGKSTTIAALAHDREIGLAFPDGVLWTSLGETPNLLGDLTVWGEALRLIPPNKTPRLEELTSQLTAVLRDKRVLLIIDDVWHVEHVAPFRVGGLDCGLVMSSRLTEVARALAPTADDVYRLPVLTDDFALELLSRLAPQAVDAHREAALELIHDLEGLPLAIQVAGRLLHEEMQMGWGVEHLIAELRQGANILTAQAPRDPTTIASSTSPSVAALLKRSTNAIDEETLVRFALLGFFVPKPATFDLQALAAAWNVDDPRPTARVLVNRGLLEPVSGGRFQMHSLLVLHAKSLLEATP
jgi:DNA-binding SARP family transcriptional activator